MRKFVSTVVVLMFALLVGSTSYSWQSAKSDWCSGNYVWSGMVRVQHMDSNELGPDSYKGHVMAPGPNTPTVSDMGRGTAKQDGLQLAFDCPRWDTRGM